MKTHVWTLEKKPTMKILNPSDFQHIDSEIVDQVGKCNAKDRLGRLRDIAEIYRVYASRAALMCREITDERKYL